MTTLTVIATMKMSETPNPTQMAILILAISLIITKTLFEATASSWLSFIVILTFSSGMMTLFIYASSLTPNEKSKTTKKKYMMMVPILAMLVSAPQYHSKTVKISMKTFSNQTILIVMTLVLILSMMTIISHSFSPQQSLTSTF